MVDVTYIKRYRAIVSFLYYNPASVTLKLAVHIKWFGGAIWQDLVNSISFGDVVPVLTICYKEQQIEIF